MGNILPRLWVSRYAKFYKIAYTTLLNGKDVAARYGVYGYPAFFLIDKEGKIIYSNAGFEAPTRLAIEKMIKEVL